MLSERLKSLRKSIGISQKVLADQLFISQQAVAKWENSLATPNPEMLAKISEIFNVSVDYLLGISDIKKAPNSDELDAMPGMQELEEVMERLSEAGRQAVIEQAQTLLKLEKNLKDKK